MPGIKLRFDPLDKAFQPRFILRFAYFIQLFAQLQLFHQERGIAHGVLFAGEIETMKRKEIFGAGQRVAKGLPRLINGGGLLHRGELFGRAAAGELIGVILAL